MTHQFPYTNLHDLNIDWILKIVKEFKEKYTDLDTTFQQMLSEIEEKGNIAIAAINANKDSALEAIDTFKEACINALIDIRQNAIDLINAAGNTKIEIIERTGTETAQLMVDRINTQGQVWSNSLQAIVNNIPATYEDAVNQLQIINSILNMNYTYPALIQGYYKLDNDNETISLQTGVSMVSTVLTSGVAGRTLDIEITDGTAIIQYIRYFTGWDDDKTQNTVQISTAGDTKTHYRYTFPNNASYATILFTYDIDASQQLNPSDFTIESEWVTNLSTEVENLNVKKVNIPLDSHDEPTNGTSGQLLMTNGDGTTEWTDVGTPTDEQIEEAVSDWLTDHPEATTTIEDGSITESKFSNDLKLQTIKDYVTPEMFGAYGDGEHDDTIAIKNAISYATENNYTLIMRNTYIISDTITFENLNTFASTSTIYYNASRDKPAIVITGYRAHAIKIGKVCDITMKASTYGEWYGWGAETYIGVKIVNCLYSDISISYIGNFTVGIQHYAGSTTPSAWNKFSFGEICNCKIGFHMLLDGNGAWLNANSYYGASFSYHTANSQFTTNPIQRYNFKQECINNTQSLSCNANVFYNFYFEYSNTAPFCAIYIYQASKFRFIACRDEVITSANVVFCTLDFHNDTSATSTSGHTNDIVFTDLLKIRQPNLVCINYNINYIFRPFAEICKFDDNQPSIVDSGNFILATPLKLYTDRYFFINYLILTSSKPSTLSDCFTYGLYTTHNDIYTYMSTGETVLDVTGNMPCIWIVHDGNIQTMYTVKKQGGTGAIVVRLFDENGGLLDSGLIPPRGIFTGYNETYGWFSLNSSATDILIGVTSNVKYIQIGFGKITSYQILSTNKNTYVSHLPPIQSLLKIAKTMSGYRHTQKPNITNGIPKGTIVWNVSDPDSISSWIFNGTSWD